MGKSVAAKLNEQFNKLQGIKENEEPIDGDKKPGLDDKDTNKAPGEIAPVEPKVPPVAEDGSLNAMGEVPNEPMAKIKEVWGDDDKKKGDAMDAMKKMSESKHPMAKKFMEAMDAITSGMEIKKVDKDGKAVNEDADGEYLCAVKPEVWANLDKGVADFGGKK